METTCMGFLSYPAATKGYKPHRSGNFIILCHRKTAEAQAQTANIMDRLQKKSVGDIFFVRLQVEDIHRVHDKRFRAVLAKECSSMQMPK